ncbi:MAG: hypothetical protein H7333_12240 [Bdellovibrionales bacterium]|nr:hypothetical protein [Oligoflexia bacterium]
MNLKWGALIAFMAALITFGVIRQSKRTSAPKDIKISDYVEGMETPPPSSSH